MFNRFFGGGGFSGQNSNNKTTSTGGGSTTDNLLPPPSRKRSSSSSSSSDVVLHTTSIPKNIKPLSNNNDHQITNRLILIKNLNEIPLNGRFVFNDEESRRLFAIFRTKKNKIYAIDEYCYHMGGPLEKGDIEDLVVNYKDNKMRKHSCVVCPWHHYYISLKTGESFYLDIDRSYKSKGQRQRTYPLHYNAETMDLYLELDLRLELNQANSPTINCTGCESDNNPIKPLDSDHYVKIHQQKYSNTESSNTKPHSVVNLKELREKRELKKIEMDFENNNKE